MQNLATQFKKYQTLILLGAAMLVALLSFFYFYSNRNNIKVTDNDEQNLGQIKETGSGPDLIREFLSVGRATLSQEGEPVGLARFWFEEGASLDGEVLFYVEYANEGSNDQHKKLIRRMGPVGEGSYEVAAEFSEGMNEWELESGEDLLFGKDLVLYEKSEETSEWLKVSNQ